ncbi:MAG: site-specific integrase [Balneolales bacterium]
MATLNFTLKTNKQKRDGTIPVYLRITENRRSRFISTGVSLHEKHWNPNQQQVRKSHPSYQAYNDELHTIKTQAENKIRNGNGKDKSITELKDTITGKGKHDFFSYAEQHLSALKSNGQYWNWKKKKVSIEKLKKFNKSDYLPFNAINGDMIERFCLFLKNKPYKNVNNTIAKNIEHIKTIYRRAHKHLNTELRLDVIEYTVKMTKTKKDKLTIEQIRALEALKLDHGSALCTARDVFMFAFYTGGIRFGDMCRLKWENISGDYLHYTMGKTANHTTVKLLSKARSILERYKKDDPKVYIFPLLRNDRDYSDPIFEQRAISSRNVLINRNLQILAKMDEMVKTGITANISTHIARHSFADYARTKEMSLYDVSKILGHSNLKITETYLKSFDQESVDNAMEKLFED